MLLTILYWFFGLTMAEVLIVAVVGRLLSLTSAPTPPLPIPLRADLEERVEIDGADGKGRLRGDRPPVFSVVTG